MVEPTEEQVAAFQRGWHLEDLKQQMHDNGIWAQPGDRTRAGLRAVLSLEAKPAPTRAETEAYMGTDW